MHITEDNQIREILLNSKTIAVLGCSGDPKKAAHVVPKYMLSKNYEIIPINPRCETIFEKKCYKRVEDISKSIDILNIFRPSEEVLDIVKSILKRAPRYIWMQKGIENVSAEKVASDHGIDVVMDRCIKIEYERLIGN